MKGIGPIIIAFVGLVMLITTLTGSAIFLAAKSESILRTAREVAIISGINTMEMAKDSLMQSLVYSSYQTIYDISKNGGYSAVPSTVKSNNGIPDWRVYGDVSGYPRNWETDMGILASTYLNKYAESLKISINYKPVAFSCLVGYCTAKASSDNPLYYTVGFANSVVTKATLIGSEEIFFQLIDKSSMTKKIKTNIQGLFSKAILDYVNKDPVKDAIVEATNSLPSECRQRTSTYCDTAQAPTCDSLYTCSDTYKTLIDNNLQVLKAQDIQPYIQTGIQADTRTAYYVLPGWSITNNGEDDSCCPPDAWKNVCNTDENGIKTCQDVCTQPHNSFTISCTYDNYAASKVLISLTDTQNKYPVYDSNAGTNDMRSATLNFYIVSGSDYSDRTRNLIPS